MAGRELVDHCAATPPSRKQKEPITNRTAIHHSRRRGRHQTGSRGGRLRPLGAPPRGGGLAVGSRAPAHDVGRRAPASSSAVTNGPGPSASEALPSLRHLDIAAHARDGTLPGRRSRRSFEPHDTRRPERAYGCGQVHGEHTADGTRPGAARGRAGARRQAGDLRHHRRSREGDDLPLALPPGAAQAAGLPDHRRGRATTGPSSSCASAPAAAIEGCGETIDEKVFARFVGRLSYVSGRLRQRGHLRTRARRDRRGRASRSSTSRSRRRCSGW